MSKLCREDSVFLGSYDQWIAFKEWSPGDHSSNETSGTIICTHGLGDTAGAFDVVGPLLAKKNYRVLAIDLLVTGSPVTPADMVFIKLLKHPEVCCRGLLN